MTKEMTARQFVDSFLEKGFTAAQMKRAVHKMDSLKPEKPSYSEVREAIGHLRNEYVSISLNQPRGAAKTQRLAAITKKISQYEGVWR